MNVAKFSLQKCGHVLAHFERSVKPGHYSNKDIDPNRTNQNENLCRQPRPKQIDYIKEKLNTVQHANRKDLVCMCSIVLDAPDTLPVNLHDRFFELSYEFLKDRYGKVAGFDDPEDVVISCYRHRDETTDHFHFAFLPIIKDENGQRFCAKEVVCKQDLSTLHQDLDAFLKEHGLRADILNGKTQRDAYGRALSVKELKRRDYERSRNRNLERRTRF